MKITRLSIENVKRISAVSITPEGNLVTIGGQNAQGKSSALDSITMALMGAATIPVRPIHDGAIKGEIFVDLGEINVTRTFSENGGTTLVVRNSDGGKLSSPQSILDALVGKLACDPLEFVRQDRHKQLETLKRLVGLDFSATEARRASLEEQRTLVGRDGKSLKAKREAMPFHPDVPDHEISAVDILTALEAARRTNEVHAKTSQMVLAYASQQEEAMAHRSAITSGVTVPQDVNDLRNDLRILQSRKQNFEMRQNSIEAQIIALRKEFYAIENSVSDIISASTETEKKIGRALDQHVIAIDEKLVGLALAHRKTSDELSLLSPIDLAPLQASLTNVERVNRQVRDNLAQRKAVADIDACREKWDILTNAIALLDEEKRKAMAEVQFPVPGLSFDSTQVLFNGVPFSQSSSAEQLKVSVAMAVSMNPKLRVVLIRDGSLLDASGLQTIAEMAEKLDVQIWLEKVSGNPSECAVYIEDGKLKETKDG